MITWYNAADVFCLASRGEGSPNVLTEALACGTPAVATNVGSVPEIMMSENRLGFCVPNEDYHAISNRVADVLMSERNNKTQATCFCKYTWDWCARLVMEIID